MSDYFLGEIRLFAFNFVPENWMACEGQTLPISAFEPLYALIGSTYGGNGVSQFNLPDLRGRVILGAGQGPGLSSYPFATNGGSETVALVNDQGPVHTHSLRATTAGDSSGTIGPNVTFASDLAATSPVRHYLYPIPSPAPPQVALDDEAVLPAPTPGSQPHDNVMPAMGLSYCIAVTNGLWPQRA